MGTKQESVSSYNTKHLAGYPDFGYATTPLLNISGGDSIPKISSKNKIVSSVFKFLLHLYP